jgi:hypothetical protein
MSGLSAWFAVPAWPAMLVGLPWLLLPADEQVSDIRIELGGYTNVDWREHLDISAGTYSGYYTSGAAATTRDPDSGRGTFCLRYCAGDLHGLGGVLWDISLASYAGSANYQDPLSGTSVALQSDIIELQGGAGYGLCTGSWSHLELMGDLGVGYIKQDAIDTSQLDGTIRVKAGGGLEGSAGAHLGWIATFEQRLVFGLVMSASWHAARIRGDFDTGTTYSGHLSEIMLSYLVCVGIRF